MQTVRSGHSVPITASGRVATARRLEAARVVAGKPSLRALAQQTGMSYRTWRPSPVDLSRYSTPTPATWVVCSTCRATGCATGGADAVGYNRREWQAARTVAQERARHRCGRCFRKPAASPGSPRSGDARYVDLLQAGEEMPLDW